MGQALADVATIGLLRQRAIHRRDVLSEQLRTALNSRVTIEQAKGVLAERLQVDMDQAFEILRSHSRNHNRRLSDLALAVVEGLEQVPSATATPQTAAWPYTPCVHAHGNRHTKLYQHGSRYVIWNQK